MPRFPIYTDADVHGPYVEGLKRNGWDVMRAVDEYLNPCNGKCDMRSAMEVEDWKAQNATHDRRGRS